MQAKVKRGHISLNCRSPRVAWPSTRPAPVPRCCGCDGTSSIRSRIRARNVTEQLEAPFGNEFANRQLACAPPYFSIRHVLTPVHTADLSDAGLITCIQFGAVRRSHGPGLRAVHEDREHKCILEADLCCKGQLRTPDWDVQIFHGLMCHSNAPTNLRGTATGARNLGTEVYTNSSTASTVSP